MRHIAAIFTVAGLLFAAHFFTAQAQVAEGAKSPVVVELYTSQGCSSCPPADAMLGELADDPDVLALSFHVDYWDYIGWKDPFALPISSQRQRSYSQFLSRRYVYTPQMVIDGRFDVVGSRRSEILSTVEKAAAETAKLPVDIDLAAGRVTIPAGRAPAQGATVWLAVFDEKHTTDVKRGENAGRELSYYNVVRELRKLGTWQGSKLEISLDLGDGQQQSQGGCAIIVQEGETGRILGAAEMPFNPT